MSALGVLSDLAAHAVQVAALVAGAAAVARVWPLARPGAALLLWQGLLALVVVLPFVQPRADGPGVVVRVVTEDGGGVPVSARGTLPPVILGLLAAGVAARLIHLAVGGRRLRRWRRDGLVFVPGPLLTEVEALAGARATIVASPKVDAPITYGVWRPIVLVPAGFGGWALGRQRDALLHELLHVRRWDWASALLEELAGALLWYHPAVAWLRGRLRLAREQAVDAAVVERTGNRREYAAMLVELATTRAAVPAATVSEGAHLPARIDALLEEVTMSKTKAIVGVALGAAAALGALAVAAHAMPIHAWSGTSGEAAIEGGATAEKKGKSGPERKLVGRPTLAYPAEAKEKKIEGIVVLDVRIDAAGAVSEVRVVKGPAELRDAAAAHVSKWVYQAGPTDTRQTLTIRFRLDKDEDKP